MVPGMLHGELWCMLVPTEPLMLRNMYYFRCLLHCLNISDFKIRHNWIPYPGIDPRMFCIQSNRLTNELHTHSKSDETYNDILLLPQTYKVLYVNIMIVGSNLTRGVTLLSQ